MNLTIHDRIKHVLGGRKLHNWGANIGITRGVLTRLNKGIMPGAEKLVPAFYAENVSLTWLIEGSGTPFLVYSSYSDAEASEQLTNLLDEENWSAYIVTDNIRHAIVLTQPCQYVVDGKDYDYIDIEILGGAVGNKTLQLVESHPCVKHLYRKQVPTEDLRRLYKGEYGTWHLLNKPGALLEGAEPVPRHDKIAEAALAYNHETGELSDDERDLIEDIRALDEESLINITSLIKKLRA